MSRSNHSFEPTALRRTILRMAFNGQSVHVACAFSIVEILSTLYRDHLRFPGNDPQHPERDYLVLSKGHGIMALYACLGEKGWIEADELEHYFRDGSRLRGLSEADIPGVEVTSGSLGHGLSVGVGLALAAKRFGTGQMCYVIVGDGEANEGAVWEAVMFAAHMKLDNLIILVDKNGFQAMGATTDVIDMGDLAAKLRAFGCETEEVDGHDEVALHEQLQVFQSLKNGRPKCIVANTVKGKGVPFMENENIWHYTRLTTQTYAAALRDLERSRV